MFVLESMIMLSNTQEDVDSLEKRLQVEFFLPRFSVSTVKIGENHE